MVGAWWAVFGRAHRGSNVGLQCFSVGFTVEYSSCFISVLNFDLSVCCFDAQMSRSLSCGPNILYVHEPQQNLGGGWLLKCKTGLNLPVVHYWPFQGCASIAVYSYRQCLSTSCLSLTVCWCCLGQTGGHLLGKSWPLGLPLVLFYFHCLCSFPVWCLGKEMEFDCIGSWSLPLHLLSVLVYMTFRTCIPDMSHVMIKPVHVICGQQWHRSACASA